MLGDAEYVDFLQTFGFRPKVHLGQKMKRATLAMVREKVKSFEKSMDVLIESIGEDDLTYDDHLLKLYSQLEDMQEAFDHMVELAGKFGFHIELPDEEE